MTLARLVHPEEVLGENLRPVAGEVYRISTAEFHRKWFEDV